MSPKIDHMKSNMKQAMFEMFGVGSGADIVVVPPQAEPITEALSPVVNEEVAVVVDAPVVNEEVAVVVDAPVAAPAAERMSRVAMSYIAAGTVFEGTMHSSGDVEVAGEFIGDIDATGAVKLFASMEGNVSAGNLTLAGCTLTGNATVADTLVVGEAAEIRGNVSAKEVRCAGQIHGDMTVGGNATLERTAQIHGNIVTGSFAVTKGAVICGGIEIKGK